jgi:RNA polymerase sigma factor (sigma-70 family)
LLHGESERWQDSHALLWIKQLRNVPATSLAKLKPFIRRAARRIMHRFPGQMARDLINDALLGEVYSRLHRFREGSFESWCYRVVQNLARSQSRSERTHQRLMQEAAQEVRAREESQIQGGIRQQHAVEAGDEEELVLSETELATVEGWDAHLRLALLGRAGLWPRVPPQKQDAWIAAFLAARGVVLDAAEILATFTDRRTNVPKNEEVARVLRVNPNTVAQWWRRGKNRLRELGDV